MPNGNSTTYSYSNLVTNVTQSPSGIFNEQVINTLGQVVSSKDANGIVNYEYYAHGKLRKMYTDHSSTEMEYDDFAHQRILIDNDAGITKYAYNSVGELITQEDAKGNFFEMTYNSVGRLEEKKANGGTGSPGGYTTTYQYMPQGVDIPSSVAAGKIDRIEKNDGQLHKINYLYHQAFGDLFKYIQTEPMGAPLTTEYSSYNSTGKLQSVLLAGGYRLNYGYHNTLGSLITIEGEDGSNPPVMLWNNHVENELWQPLEFTFGSLANGLKKQFEYNGDHQLTKMQVPQPFSSSSIKWGQTYDFDVATGNLLKRQQLDNNNTAYLSETFKYDASQVQLLSSQGQGSLFNISPSFEGNFDTKSDAGAYTYHGSKNHAVETIVPTPGLQPFPLAQQDIVYNAVNKALTITENNKQLDITYGPDEERVFTSLSNITPPSIIKQKWFAPDFEHYNDCALFPGGMDVNYVYSPDGLVAVVEKSGTSATYKVRFVVTDYLGSINYIMDNTGTRIEEYSYDAWGRRREYSSWVVYDHAKPASSNIMYDRGYTGHEHLEEFGLINMNGRMYDPIVAKMLSPDNFNATPGSALGMNRYCYVNNNPLKYTDPNGQFLKAISWGFLFTCTLIQSGNLSYSTKVANTVIGGMSVMGQATIYKDKNFKLTAGLDVFSIGVSANAYYNNGDFSANASIGYSLYSKSGYASLNGSYETGDWQFGVGAGYSKGDKGYFPQFSAGATYNSGNSRSYTFGFTHYGGKDAQTNWFFSIKDREFSISTTNDAFLGHNIGGGDKFRTASLEIGLGELSVGMNIYTNDPGDTENPELDVSYESKLHGINRSGKGAYINGRRIHSNLYLGINSGGTVSRIGIDAPWVQDLFQNGIHQSWWAKLIPGWHGSPYFPTDYDTPTKLYMKTGLYYPYSLY